MTDSNESNRHSSVLELVDGTAPDGTTLLARIFLGDWQHERTQPLRELMTPPKGDRYFVMVIGKKGARYDRARDFEHLADLAETLGLWVQSIGGSFSTHALIDDEHIERIRWAIQRGALVAADVEGSA